MKRVHVIGGKPVFFKSAQMKRAGETLAALLGPFVPDVPFDGPLTLSIRFVYPHLKATPKRDAGLWLPKVSAPDCDNVGKSTVDLLASMRFIVNDARIARLSVEKWHGPESDVGIRIEIAQWEQAA